MLNCAALRKIQKASKCATNSPLMGISGDNRSEVVSRRGLVLYAVKYTIFLYKLTGTDLTFIMDFGYVVLQFEFLRFSVLIILVQ